MNYSFTQQDLNRLLDSARTLSDEDRSYLASISTNNRARAYRRLVMRRFQERATELASSRR